MLGGARLDQKCESGPHDVRSAFTILVQTGGKWARARFVSNFPLWTRLFVVQRRRSDTNSGVVTGCRRDDDGTVGIGDGGKDLTRGIAERMNA